MSTSEKKEQVRHTSRSHPQDRHAGGREIEDAFERQQSREATQSSPWEDHPLPTSIKRWLNEAGPFCGLHLQRVKGGGPESNDAQAYITSETFEDIFGSAPTQKEVEHARRQSKVC
ncbi:MAG: hypothetical protein ALECFALPRED_000472 [Alectoria fallacina]|uniref:Uncharacterized protein n=1 Tax=Alectoria fallacina TaxID=1903189 RepID=A0A8H3F5J5_9LECA|nr:MAG: hypothetical protein ALECFALPRED_000472 [Alectoria fallacina]